MEINEMSIMLYENYWFICFYKIPSLLSTNVGFIDILTVCVLFFIRVRVIRERLSATPGHVIGQEPAPGGGVVPCGGGTCRGELKKLRVVGLVFKSC